MTQKSVVYTDPPWLVEHGAVRPHLFAAVEARILEGVALRAGPNIGGRYITSGPDLNAVVAGAEVLIVYRCPVTPDLLDAAGESLRAVIRQGVGFDNLNVPLLSARGISGYNVPDYCVDEVATHATALALALERGIIPQHQTLAGGLFDIYAGGIPRRVSRRTLGIVGFGRIGRAVSRKLGVQYGQTIVYDPYVGRDLAEGYGAQAVETLQDLLHQADLVTLHCPLTEETSGLIGWTELQTMRRDAYIVNAARGRLLQPEALGRALRDGIIAGAALDVFSPENPHEDPAWARVLSYPNVVVTSHRAFLSLDAERSSRERVAKLARSLMAGKVQHVGRLA